jgi:hypothetical protein
MWSRRSDTVRLMTALDRRSLLLAGAASAGGALLPARAVAAAEAAAPDPRSAMQFFADRDMNFQTLFALGATGYGAAEFGEIATAVDAANAAGATYDAIYDAFTAMGQRVSGYAETSARAGNVAAQRGALLRAASYLAMPLYFVLGTTDPGRQAAAYRAMNARWDAAASLLAPRAQRVQIPYGHTTLPGWFLRPPGPPRRRPTVILTNGNDAQAVALFVYGGAAAVARGMNALIYEGPGQGSMLFLRGLPFRPDWEHVVTPIVDWLRRRRDVDPERIALSGWSQGGELVARAAAYEHRLAALVCDPGIVHYATVFTLPQELIDLVTSGQEAQADAQWASIIPGLPASVRFAYAKGSAPYRPTSFSDLVKQILRYDISAQTAARIRAHTLVLGYEGETFFPGQAQQLYERLRAPKAFRYLTAAEGAQMHDAPMAPQRRNQIVFDWLGRVLDA